MRKMNDKELCKKCIYYDDFCCRNNKAICVNNSEYRDAEMVINAIINRKVVVVEDTGLTADVQPVKRGKWLNTRDKNKKMCSCCGVIHFIVQYPFGRANHCPNCGARMDGDTE